MGSASSVLNDPKGHLLHSSWPSRMQGAEAANIAPGVQGHSMAPAALLALWGWRTMGLLTRGRVFKSAVCIRQSCSWSSAKTGPLQEQKPSGRAA